MKRLDKKYYINVPIADFICQIVFENKKYFVYFQKKYFQFRKIIKTDYSVLIKDNKSRHLNVRFNRKSNQAVLSFPYRYFTLRNLMSLVAIAISTLLIKRDILILHSSALVINGLGYVFCGKRGAGKSTIIKLADKYKPLSDDATIIRKVNNKYYIYPSFFDRKRCKKLGNQRVPLKGIFLLQKKDKTYFKNIPVEKNLQELINNNFMHYIGYFGTSMEKNMLIKSCLDIADKIPVHKLFFTKSRDFLRVLDK